MGKLKFSSELLPASSEVLRNRYRIVGPVSALLELARELAPEVELVTKLESVSAFR